MSKDLEFTGERFTPECLREIRYEHLHRYALAARWVAGLKVLDAACGEGYGSHWLARSASSVTGLDISADAVEHARSRYASDRLEFVQADCCATPFEDDSFDCIVSFETLEHLEQQEALLAEFRRILRPSGFLLISSPDKAVYNDKMGNENPFHVRELYRREFEELLATQFPAVQLLGQKLGFFSMAWPLQLSGQTGLVLQRESEDEFREAAEPSTEPVYLLAACANHPDQLPGFDKTLYLFDDEIESVYLHYYHEIRHNLSTGVVLQELREKIEQLQKELDVARSETEASLDQHHADKAQASFFSEWLKKLAGKAD